MQGKRANSKLIIHERYTYILDKTDVRNNEVTHYVRCKYHTCPARAVIKNSQLKRKPEDEDRHTCAANEGAGYNKILMQEALTRMKKRAAREASSYYVSIYMT